MRGMEFDWNSIKAPGEIEARGRGTETDQKEYTNRRYRKDRAKEVKDESVLRSTRTHRDNPNSEPFKSKAESKEVPEHLLRTNLRLFVAL